MAEYGLRPNGTPKGPGWLGPLPHVGGGVSTELSIGVNLDGKEQLIPALVPTLTQDEINHLLGGGSPTEAIVNKAVAHAQPLLAAGKSPFKEPSAAGALNMAGDSGVGVGAGTGTLDFFNTPQGGNVLALALGMGSKLFNQKGSNADVLSNLVMQYAGAQQQAQQLKSALSGLGTLASTNAIAQTAPVSSAAASSGTTPAAPASGGNTTAAAPVLPTANSQMATPAAGSTTPVTPQQGLGSHEFTLGVLGGLLGGQTNSPFNFHPKY